MARKTIAQLEQEIADLKRWHDEKVERIRELTIDLDNAKNEIARLTEKLAKMGKSERFSEQPEQSPATASPESVILPDKPKRGRKPKIDTETKAYIHALRAAVDGSGRPYNSLAQIAEHTGISKTQVYAILQEPVPVGKWYSTKKDGSRIYYKDYRSAIRSGNDIHFETESPLS